MQPSKKLGDGEDHGIYLLVSATGKYHENHTSAVPPFSQRAHVRASQRTGQSPEGTKVESRCRSWVFQVLQVKPRRGPKKVTARFPGCKVPATPTSRAAALTRNTRAYVISGPFLRISSALPHRAITARYRRDFPEPARSPPDIGAVSLSPDFKTGPPPRNKPKISDAQPCSPAKLHAPPPALPSPHRRSGPDEQAGFVLRGPSCR